MITKQTGATYQDVVDAPEHAVAEVVDGALNLSPRPANPASSVTANLVTELLPPFHRGRGGPGGWLILIEPELHLGPHVMVPDIAGWRRERLPYVPDGPAIKIAPDWVCEVLSPSTERYDRTTKLMAYGRLGVRYAWLVHPTYRLVEVFRRDDLNWIRLYAHAADEKIRAEPFAAIELDLSNLWADLPTHANEPSARYG